VIRHGLVFQSFDPEVHLIDRFDIPSNWHRWLICDPQFGHFGVLFFAADEWGNYYIWDELFSQEESIAHRAEIMAAKVGQTDRKLPVYVDSANPQIVMELNYHFSRVGAPLGAMPIPMKKDISKFLFRVHSMLEPSEKRNFHPATGLKDVYGAPRLLIFNDLVSTWMENTRLMRTSRLLWEMKRLTWGPGGKPNKDSAGGADMCDALSYGCSIVASGRHPAEVDTWKEGLSARDLALHEAMERMDKRGRRPEWALELGL